MRRLFASAVGLCATVFLSGMLGAQEPLPANPAPTLSPPPAVTGPVQPGTITGTFVLAPPPAAAPAPVDYQPSLTGDRESMFALDVLIGQQLGIRAQVGVYRGDRQEVVGELFYGLLLHSLGSSEAIGGGARYLLRRCSADSTNSVVFGPGLDVFYQTDNRRLTLLNPSVELSWLHGFGDRCGWEIGLNAGAGIAVSGHTRRDSGAGSVTSLISFFTGFRF